MHDVGLDLPEQSPEFEYDQRVAHSDFAAHLFDDQRRDARLRGKPRHIAFVRRHGSANQYRLEGRLELLTRQTRRQPRDVFGRPANVETVNDADDTNGAKTHKKTKVKGADGIPATIAPASTDSINERRDRPGRFDVR